MAATSDMPITPIHSFLVQPGKNLDAVERVAVSGTEIRLNGKIFEMMRKIYSQSSNDGNLSVRFVSDSKQIKAASGSDAVFHERIRIYWEPLHAVCSN